ncbi:SpoIIE family protein phosphatase [Sediminitomix flava]|nr:SpoIIE family protein phosphatase [Sediminitomix flava]
MTYSFAVYFITIATYLVYIYLLFYTGGPSSPYKTWLVTMISSALWYFDKKNAQVNAVLVIFLFSLMSFIAHQGLYVFPNHVPETNQTLHESFVYTTFITFYLSFIFMYEGALQKSTKTVKKQNEEIMTQNEELNQQQEEMLAQNEHLTKTQELIESSLKYARRIQKTMLPKEELLAKDFKGSFVLNKPKHIVGGDFFWYAQKGDHKITIIADCTGHGVPAALLTMLGHNMLDQIIHKENILTPSKILLELDLRLRDKLNYHINDGMDMSILSINEKEQSFLFAGAKQNAIRISADGTLENLIGDKSPIGSEQHKNKSFVDYPSNYNEGDTFYMFSDGFQDQFGGDDNSKYLRKRFRNLLSDISSKDMPKQKEILESEFITWKSNFPQTDDILVVGIKQ